MKKSFLSPFTLTVGLFASSVSTEASIQNIDDFRISPIDPPNVSEVAPTTAKIPEEFILTIPSQGELLLAGHYSHVSHASHASHASHCSGYTWCPK